MKYALNVYYKEKDGAVHERVHAKNLHYRIGKCMADSILITAANRMIEKSLPEVQAFFERGGRQVISANLTSRGDVYIEAVEIAE